MPFQENKPYIFISYAHKDNGIVLPILEQLDKLNVNFWYDNGIEAGSDWNDFIANKIRHCNKMICFISDYYAGSTNCIKELYFATDKKINKKVLSIYLKDKVALPDGVTMQLLPYQSLYYTKFNGASDICSALYNEPFLSNCKLSSATVNPAQPAVTKPRKAKTTKKKNSIVFCLMCAVALYFLWKPTFVSIADLLIWTEIDSGFLYASIVSVIVMIIGFIIRCCFVKSLDEPPCTTILEKTLFMVTTIFLSVFLNSLICVFLYNIPLFHILFIVCSFIFNGVLEFLIALFFSIFVAFKNG